MGLLKRDLCVVLCCRVILVVVSSAIRQQPTCYFHTMLLLSRSGW